MQKQAQCQRLQTFKKIDPQKLDAIKICLTQTSNEVGDMVDIQQHLGIYHTIQEIANGKGVSEAVFSQFLL
ncbi:MAG: hypothetical protein LBF65_00095 [Holosporales bacterium]|nr:hypothetical protein [Holosporales bacterium]